MSKAEQRSRFARSVSALLAMPAMCAAIDAEVEATLAEHPMIPRTETARRILWALAFAQLSQSALTLSAEQPQPETQTA